MLVVKGMSGVGAITAYLSNSDYYSEGERVMGQWMGRGAELLGLEGAVKIEDLEAVLQGNNPHTGEYLKPRKNSDSVVERTTKNGEVIEDQRKARNMYDCVFSAPKALSVLWMVEPETALAAHNAGVIRGAEVMESQAGSRIRMNNANETRVTSNLVIARYDHLTSRALDPQIHSHLAAANLQYDGTEQKWKALSPQEMYAQKRYTTAAYRNEVEAVVNERGYETYPMFKKGKYVGFGIVGMDEKLLDKFSKRTKEKEAAIQTFISEKGRQPSASEISLLVRETRDKKLIRTTPEVLALQQKQLTPEDSAALDKLVTDARERGSVREYGAAAPALEFATEHTFERVCTTKEWELKATALEHSSGKIDFAELNGRLAGKIATGEMLGAKGEVATEETLERERRMIQTVDAGIGKFQPLGRGREFVGSPGLTEGQRGAVERALASRDLVFDISGSAGSGKTTLLKDLKRGLAEARVSTVAVGPSRTSVEQLQKDGFPQAITIAELLISPQKQAELRGQALIVDEVGMVGSKNMDELLSLATKYGARMVTVGDTKQIRSVDAGDAARILQQHSNMHTANVNEVVRQRDPEVRAAVQALRTNPALGYERLEALGAFREVHWRERAAELSKEYLIARSLPNAKGDRSSVLVIASTHEDIKNISHAIRTDLKKLGEIGQGKHCERHVDLKWTEAERKQTQNYQPGQVLTFHRAVADVAKKNESLEVISSDRGAITARRESGKTVRLTSQHVKSYGVFEKDVMEVAAGDKLLLQANWKDKGNGKTFQSTNGEMVAVASVDDGGKIKLEDGRELPANYKQFASGYVITAHKSQAKTVDRSVVSADGMSHDEFYVANTRSRELAKNISSDLLGLQERIGVSADRQSAIELAERAAALRRQSHSYEAQIGPPQISRKPVQIERQLETERYEHSITY